MSLKWRQPFETGIINYSLFHQGVEYFTPSLSFCYSLLPLAKHNLSIHPQCMLLLNSSIIISDFPIWSAENAQKHFFPPLDHPIILSPVASVPSLLNKTVESEKTSLVRRYERGEEKMSKTWNSVYICRHGSRTLKGIVRDVKVFSELLNFS